MAFASYWKNPKQSNAMIKIDPPSLDWSVKDEAFKLEMDKLKNALALSSWVNKPHFTVTKTTTGSLHWNNNPYSNEPENPDQVSFLEP